MKKLSLLSLIFLLALFIQPLNAQVQVGVQAGVNVTDIKTDLTQAGFKTAFRTRFLVGGMLSYNFLPVLGLQLEPAYIQKGAAVNISTVEGGIPIDLEATISANYIDLPVLLKASLPSGFVRPYLLAGGSVALLLGDAKLMIDKASSNGQDVTSLIPSDQREQTIKIKKTDFILTFGAGITIPISLFNLFIEARYDLGLKNVNDEPADNTEFKTRGIQIKTGIMFPL